jgi:exodeoxyribonuclease VII large subunit
MQQRLDERGAALQSFTRQRLRERAMRLDALRRALGLLDVQHVLDRGYALVRDHTGRVVSDVAQLQAGAALRLDLARGRARVRVEALECGLPSATSPKESP